MLWRFANKAFGWQFVHAKNTADSIVRRVRKTAKGERYFTYFSGHLVFIDRPGSEGWIVTDLTASRQKDQPHD